MAYPTDLDSFTDPLGTDTTDSPSHAGLHTSTNSAVEALEAKVGIDSSAVATSLDYLVKNTSSNNPGHKHTLANGATDVTATYTELNQLDGVTVGGTSAGDIITVGGANILDEDDMASDSASLPSSQQATKAYIDSLGLVGKIVKTGWGYIVGDGTEAVEKQVTFASAFTSAPIVLISFAGAKTSSAPSAITELTTPSNDSATNQISASVYSISTTGFYAQLSRGTTLGATAYYGFTWIAIG